MVNQVFSGTLSRIDMESFDAKIQSLISHLRAIHKPFLAQDIENHAYKTIREYANELWSFKNEKEIEPILLASFEKELERIGYTKEATSQIATSFAKYKTIQTAPHLGLTESARMLTVNWMSSRSLPEDAHYLVGMFSGVPFSNLTKPGSLNWSMHHAWEEVTGEKKEDSQTRLSLFPSTKQDALVYGSTIPEKMCGRMKMLKEPLQNFYTQPILGASYTAYALMHCAKLESQILGLNSKGVYFDINEVIREYMLNVLTDTNHFIYKIFFDPLVRTQIVTAFGSDITMFYAPYISGTKYESMEKILLTNELLCGEHTSLPFDQKILLEKLQDRTLCPGLFLVYTILTFINHIQCLGSFAQAEYLPEFKMKWSETKLFADKDLAEAPVNNLTTGMVPSTQFHDVTPLDILLESDWQPDETMRFGEFLFGIENLLYKPKK